jgi:hypothetical protein
MRRRRECFHWIGMSLEDDFERKLNHPGAALIVKSTCRPEALVQHFGGLPEEKVRQVRIDISKTRVIEDIECFDLELHVHCPVQVVALSDSDVSLHLTESAKKIPRSISLDHTTWQTEGRIGCVDAAIEDAFSRICRAI